MHLVDLSRIRARELVAVLECLLAQAQAGDISGLAVCVKTTSGHEHAAFAGTYKPRPAEAAQAALRLSMKLTQAHDAIHGPP